MAVLGGGILNRGADVVGLSNLFGSQMDRVWQSLMAMAGKIFPGQPLVGYEHGHDLAAAKSAGFETIGLCESGDFLPRRADGGLGTEPEVQGGLCDTSRMALLSQISRPGGRT